MIEQKFSLELTTNGIQRTVYARKGESNARKLSITLTENGKVASITGYTIDVLYDMYDSDGKQYYDEIENNGNPIEFTVPAYACLSAADRLFEIRFTNTDGDTVFSPQFRVIVEDSLISESGVAEKPEVITYVTARSGYDLVRTKDFSDVQDNIEYLAMYKQDKITDTAKLSASLVDGLATVATTGSYSDLTEKPVVPSLDGYATEEWVEGKGYLKTDDASETYATKTELTQASHMELADRDAPSVAIKTIAEIYEALSNNRVLTYLGNPLNIRRFDSTQFLGAYIDGVYGFAVSMSRSTEPTLLVKTERTLATSADINTVNESISKKQNTLVSGTNIKTINEQSILGSGNIDIAGGSGNVDDVIVNGSSVVNDNKQAIITIPAIPTNVSAFTNDAGYLTEHQSLDGYATEEWVEDKGYITSAYHDSTKADTFTTDTTVTEGSANPVSSGAVYTAISNAIADLDTIIGTGVIE